jgi:4-phospho-D-threonate 3-dehydrogenase / 4-phospho-D-erythronate 3-dehydrogenase
MDVISLNALPILAITMGDPAGVGPEVAVRAFSDNETYHLCRPLLVGDGSVIRATIDALGSRLSLHEIQDPSEAVFETNHINLLDLRNVDLSRLERAKVSAQAGRAAYEYIIRGIDLAMEGKVEGIVTCPIHKDALNQAGYHYPGHTEIVAERTGTKDYAMMLTAGGLRIVLVTIHVSLQEALSQINEERILRAIKLAHETGRLLGIDHPRIAVPGLNPHAGEGGMFGCEEIEIIEPTVKKALAMGYDARGPFSPDTIFYRAVQGEFDFVTPLYHDQGLIPIKLIGFGAGVNVTLGLPIIRTSVDHGTAFDIAWQCRASAGSLMEAIRLAAQMANIKKCQGPRKRSLQ